MEYKRFVKRVYSESLGEDVSILEYGSKNDYPYCVCDLCGKDIVKKMFVVQSVDSGIERMYLGSECIKKFLKGV